VVLSFDVYDTLPDQTSRVGNLLRKILPPAFRAYRQEFGVEGIHVHDTVALAAVTDPTLFVTEEMAGDVETMGELTMGATVFDRRRRPAWRRNMEVAVEIDAAKVIAAVLQGLSTAGETR
jgi:inosine-uridine nucleoside N-ribohydrolase